MRKIKKNLMIFTSLFLLVGCAADNTSDFDLKEEYSAGETFVFNNLEITIGADYTICKVENRFDDDYQKPVIRFPITVKNIDDEMNSLSIIDYKVFTPNGVEAKRYYSSWDDSIDIADELASNMSYTKYIYTKYDGDGYYTIKFGLFTKGTKVKINVIGGEAVLPQKTTFDLGETFVYESFQFTFGSNYSFTKITNQYSADYNKPVIKIPASVKNIGSETNSVYWYIYHMFNSKGNEVKSEKLYFDDNLDGCMDNLMPGATLNKNLYFLYDGDGIYTLEMNAIAVSGVKIKANIIYK